ncbi:hypothetical protein Dimus_015472 [Dionaea muscipula]
MDAVVAAHLRPSVPPPPASTAAPPSDSSAPQENNDDDDDYDDDDDFMMEVVDVVFVDLPSVEAVDMIWFVLDGFGYMQQNSAEKKPEVPRDYRGITEGKDRCAEGLPRDYRGIGISGMDRGTSYFYSLLKTRRRKLHISSLVREDGVTVSTSKEIGEEMVNFFGKLMGSDACRVGTLDPDVLVLGPVLSREQQLLHVAPFSPRDVRIALWDI